MDLQLNPGTAVKDLTEDEFNILMDEFDMPSGVERGGASTRIAAFFGFWRKPSANLRVGIRVGNGFVPVGNSRLARVTEDESINLVLSCFHLPNLPSQQCIAQLTWTASHWFSKSRKEQVSHTTACRAGELGTASAVGLPVFGNLRAKDGIELSIGVYVMADKGSEPILDLLSGPVLRGGLKLAGTFNPVFAATGPYIQAAIRGLMRSSRKNFKLVEWFVGLGVGNAPFSLCYGEYILLDGMVRTGTSADPLDWEKLRWQPNEERVTYGGSAFHNPYLMVHVLPAAAES